MALLMIIQQSHIHLNELVENESFQPEILVPAPYTVKLMSLGFDHLMADCYWLAFVGYVGDLKARKVDHYALADKYIELVTGLDPYLVNAYWFAAFTVGAEQKRPQRAAELIERGIAANQDNWYLPFIAGINQYLYAKNELAAAKYYRQASRYPDAPPWLARQAEILEARIPSTVKEINTWTSIYSSDADERVREMARQKLIDLWGKIIATRPPKNIRDKAVAALKDLGVDVEFYLEHFQSKSR